MTAESQKMWRCSACNRLLVERSVDHARRRHAELMSRVRCGSAAEWVGEALWPAYLASLRRCRCGSRRQLKVVPPHSARGQLALQLEPVVLQ